MQLARCLRSLRADVQDAKRRGLHLFYASPVELKTAGPSPESRFNGGKFSYMSDNIVLLSTDIKNKTRRSVAIIKARASKHDLAVHETEITETGFRVL